MSSTPDFFDESQYLSFWCKTFRGENCEIIGLQGMSIFFIVLFVLNLIIYITAIILSILKIKNPSEEFKTTKKTDNKPKSGNAYEKSARKPTTPDNYEGNEDDGDYMDYDEDSQQPSVTETRINVQNDDDDIYANSDFNQECDAEYEKSENFIRNNRNEYFSQNQIGSNPLKPVVASKPASIQDKLKMFEQPTSHSNKTPVNLNLKTNTAQFIQNQAFLSKPTTQSPVRKASTSSKSGRPNSRFDSTKNGSNEEEQEDIYENN